LCFKLLGKGVSTSRVSPPGPLSVSRGRAPEDSDADDDLAAVVEFSSLASGLRQLVVRGGTHTHRVLKHVGIEGLVQTHAPHGDGTQPVVHSGMVVPATTPSPRRDAIRMLCELRPPPKKGGARVTTQKRLAVACRHATGGVPPISSRLTTTPSS
jgi:hypothetical protein